MFMNFDMIEILQDYYSYSQYCRSLVSLMSLSLQYALSKDGTITGIPLGSAECKACKICIFCIYCM